ncbi:MAG: DUF4974 domain-containing protein [Odoribacter sp.]
MEDLSESLFISRLIVKSFQEELTEVEKQKLDKWLADEKNHQLYQSLRKADLGIKKQEMRAVHSEKAWKNLERKIHSIRRSPMIHLIQYAAVILLLLSIGTLIYLHPISINKTIVQLYEQEIPQPGSSKAVLILESGKKIELNDKEDFFLQQDSTISLNNTGNTLKVKLSQQQSYRSAIYQTLDIPKGGEYKLILSDGSVVWLNSDSRLRFPSSFPGKKRTVYLEGEAYFEVSPDSLHPFIVSSKGMDVEVLGTKFNVKAYPEDVIIYTTLCQGSVKTINQQTGLSLLLEPNQQARFTKQNGKIEKQEVDSRLFTGWTGGRFVFENETLEEIMKQLERWYNIDVFYQNPSIKKYKFTGDVDRFDEISTILNMIEKTYNITFSINQKTIVIKNR